MRLVVADCSIDYSGRLSAHLPMARRLLLIKADGTLVVHADNGSKPLNWMSPPCTIEEISFESTTSSQVISGRNVSGQDTSELAPSGKDTSKRASSKRASSKLASSGQDTSEPIAIDLAASERTFVAAWIVRGSKNELLNISIAEIHSDISLELGEEPGLIKHGAESELQQLLADDCGLLEDGLSLIRREWPTELGPVDLLCRSSSGETVAVEIKRVGEIDGVEQLTRYLEWLNRDPLLAPVRGIFTATRISPQAQALANARDIQCVEFDLEVLSGRAQPALRLF